MIAPVPAHIFNVDFIDPLSRRVVYELTIDTTPHEGRGHMIERAIRWAELRGVNVKACTHRVTRIV